MTKIRVGTVIAGTSRPQDVIPALYRELTWWDAAKAVDISIPNEIDELDDSNPWWKSYGAEECAIDLADALDSLAPEGMYFGPHPGDGADLGFWRVEQ